ncbi:putative Small heat-shock protein [Hibiscus syriacus]|uniref:Small heat-shock protein n=1 Tax=Hibiscus syriacus TaxID=106335 RepID=A0A6A2XYI9_HIBSY|nr:double-stranded RNA-binding protein 1-like [Hibiscus syriacus]KAE8663819.1 putative Small heat-shock protein [Hibiscus syriacus]
MYKSKLQELCHQRQWALPRYTSMKDGPDHNPCFKSSVFLNGTSFHSSVPFKSCKEAQNDAAKSALLHFTSSSSYSLAAANPVQEADLGMYKNLLQELTQREEWSLPEYKTTQCGEPHRPKFFSTVQAEGHVFHGKGGKSKREAEINAAKLAYTNLIQRLKGETLKSASGSDLTPAVENEEHAKEDAVREVKKGDKEGSNSISYESTYFDISCLSISDSKTEEIRGSRSYLLNNRFRVYPCYPDIAFPQGITVVPISEDKWVAVSLEFPNETDE